MADRLLERPLRASAPRVALDPLKGGDIYAWAMRQAALLREKRFGEIDILNVADEIEDLGKSDLRALTSNVENILMHMLKWDHQPEKRSRSWTTSILNGRLGAGQLLEESPSLNAKQQTIVEGAYRRARVRAANETRVSISSFPESCPYGWADIMEKRYEIDDGQD